MKYSFDVIKKYVYGYKYERVMMNQKLDNFSIEMNKKIATEFLK